jgi:hypothetical protein
MVLKLKVKDPLLTKQGKYRCNKLGGFFYALHVVGFEILKITFEETGVFIFDWYYSLAQRACDWLMTDVGSSSDWSIM